MAADTPAAELVDGELTVRRLTVADAPSLDAAISSSLDHLRPWMPWAALEPLTAAERVALIERWDGEWSQGDNYGFGMFVGGEVVGACGLHRRIGPGGLEAGYWVRADRIGAGIATRAARLLTNTAFELNDVGVVEIHHDRANVRSGRVPEKLGFIRVGETPDEVSAPGEVGIDVCWRMQRADWTAQASAAGLSE
jgi:ribosomal-protein-serine acetyltransferase